MRLVQFASFAAGRADRAPHWLFWYVRGVDTGDAFGSINPCGDKGGSAHRDRTGGGLPITAASGRSIA